MIIFYRFFDLIIQQYLFFGLSLQCLQELQDFSVPEAAELIDILNKYSMEGLLHVHDSIAEREPLPVGNLPEEEVLDRVTNYPEESVKIVRIDKTNEPLVRLRERERIRSYSSHFS